jgi:PKD repeat protein
MKKILLPLLFFSTGAYAQVCNPTGNIVIFSNYDGGTLNINVDMNIPNLKIGIVSYEAVEVTFSGSFVGNITAVEYAGYNNSPNTNCSPTISTTNFAGLPGGVTPNIEFAPPSTFSDPDGYSSIICAYSCTTGSMGGCNTPEQVYDYFQNLFSGSVYSHKTQYGCWSGTQNISDGGNCCLAPAAAPVANFSITSDSICVGECVSFTDLSTNTPTSWAWTFPGATTTTSTLQNPIGICYNAAGTYNVTLTAGNGAGSDPVTIPIVVSAVNTTTSTTGITITSSATSATYQWFNCGTGSIISGATSSSFTATANGSYAVIVTQNGCTDTSACTNITSVGLVDVPVADLIRVYPNPSNGIFMVNDAQGGLAGQHLTITNLAGEVVYTTKITGSTTTLDLSRSANGIYFINISSPFGKLVTKITKN